jgi:hypothetical protein
MPATTGAAAGIAPPPPGTAPYDPGPDREKARGEIALSLVWTLVGIVIAALLMALVTAIRCSSIRHPCSTEATNLVALKTILETLLTPLVGLVGAVTGFYFGDKSGRGGGQ